MDWGIENRISRIIRPDTGRCMWLAADHGYFLGPIRKLEEPRKTIKPLLPYIDALMLTRGILRTSVPFSSSVPIILRVSGGNSILGKELSNERITTSIKDAIRLNVSAVAVSIYIGAEYEHQTLMNLSRVINEAYEYGIPVLAVTAVGKELKKRNARYLSLCCRIAAELGANIIKTYYCDNFEKVITCSPVPIVIAGGPKLDTERDVMQIASDAVNKGAAGVDMGRNIWQSEHPIAMAKAIRHIVHKNGSVEEAEAIFKAESAI